MLDDAHAQHLADLDEEDRDNQWFREMEELRAKENRNMKKLKIPEKALVQTEQKKSAQ